MSSSPLPGRPLASAAGRRVPAWLRGLLRGTRPAPARRPLACEPLEARDVPAGFRPFPTYPSWTMNGFFEQAGTVDLQRGAALAPTGGEAAALPRDLPVNAKGLPLLNSRPNLDGFEIYLDVSSYWAGREGPDQDGFLGFSMDGDFFTYTFDEQLNVYNAWRRIAASFAQFNVNVTTVQPPLAPWDPNFAWMKVSSNFGGGAAFFNSPNKFGPSGHDDGWDIVNGVRTSAVTHEIGHIMGLAHQANFDANGNDVQEYSGGDYYRNVPIMGVDPAGTPASRWWFGRGEFQDGGRTIFDDVARIENTIWRESGSVPGVDQYRPDDYGNDMASAYVLPVGSQQLDGYLERNTDADYFRIAPTTAGNWNITATPLFASTAEPKLELLDAAGNVIAGRDDADLRNGPTNEQLLNLRLDPGTYYVRVTSGGDYAETGYYQLAAAQLPGTFVSNDVGVPVFDGNVTYDPAAGVFTQGAGGTDIWNTGDQFRFTYEPLTGDGSITARVDGVDNVGFFTKAGVMVRDSLAGDSPHAFIGLNPGGRLDTIWRGGYGWGSANVNGDGPGPWVRLTRAGDTITWSSSADGVAWTELGSRYIPMGRTVLVGLATCAWSDRAQAFSTFSHVTITGDTSVAPPVYGSLPAPATLTAVPTPVAATWVDIAWAPVAGATGYRVERSADGVGFYTIGTAAADSTFFVDFGAWGSMRWFYRVSAIDAAGLASPPAAANTVNKPNAPGLPWYTAPVIVRSSSELDINILDTQGEFGYRVDLSTDGGGSYFFYTNLGANETSRNLGGLQPGTAYKVRVTPYNAAGDGPSLVLDGVTRFEAVRNLRFTDRRPAALTIAWDGLSGADGYYIDRSSDGVNWGNVATLGRGTSSWTDTNVAPGGEYYYRIFPFNGSGVGPQSDVIFAAAPAASLPVGWANSDVGAVGGAGAAVSTGPGAWTVVGSGADVFGTADGFQFAYQQLTGDVTVVARVAGVEDTNPFAKAGVMIRSGLAADAPHAMMEVTPGGRAEFLRRTSDGAFSAVTFDNGVSAPYWVKLVRQGSTFRAYDSADGVTWRLIGTDTIPMGQTVYAGLAVCSHDNGRLNTATFTDVLVTATPRPLPAPWRDADVGDPGRAGDAGYSAGTFTVTGGGADIWNTADQFHFVYQAYSGNFQVVARVAAQTDTDPFAKAGVMVRGDLSAGSPFALLYASPGGGVRYDARRTPGGFGVFDGAVPGTAPTWVKLVRTGDSLSGYASADGQSWTLVGTDLIPMASTVYVGLAVTSHNADRLGAAEFDHVAVGVPRYDAARAIDAGGGAAGRFQADAAADGGNTYAVGTPIDTSGVVNPAPQAVYRSERWGQFSYHVPGFQPGATYAVRLHFAEIFWTAPGQRRFNVAVNGRRVLTDFDIVAAAGGPNKAVVRTFLATADADGRIAVSYLYGAAGDPKASGVEVVRADPAAAVKVARSGLILNRQTGLDVGTLTLTNTASAALTGTVVVVLRGLPPGVELANAAGVTEDGDPYLVVDVSNLGRGKPVRVAVQFRNPARSAVIYDTEVYAARLTI